MPLAFQNHNISLLGLIIVVLAIIIIIAIFFLPVRIGRWRNISENHMLIVKILSIIGIFTGITWLIALILACVLPSTSPPLPQSFTTETCSNCGQPIGKLETSRLWKNHIVCNTCYNKLA